MSDPLPTQLIQIEEPDERKDSLDDAGLSIGLDFTSTGLRVAVSIGGNAEIVRGPDGGIDFISAADGQWAFQAEAAVLGLMRATQRTVAGAVIVAPALASTAIRLALLEAAETAGLDVRAVIERPLAIALGGGLGRQSDGDYLFLEELGIGVLHARLEVADGEVRLVGMARAERAADMGETFVTDRPVVGLITLGDIQGFPEIERLSGFEAPELAVVGAALRAEEMR